MLTYFYAHASLMAKVVDLGIYVESIACQCVMIIELVSEDINNISFIFLTLHFKYITGEIICLLIPFYAPADILMATTDVKIYYNNYIIERVLH